MQKVIPSMSRWTVAIGAAVFIGVLFISAYWEADIRWLHFFQAWMYLATIILDAEIAQSFHGGVAVIRGDRRRGEAGELEPAVAVGSAHHGNLDALIAQSSDTSGPFSFDRGPPFELEAELAKEINRLSEVIDDDSYVVHSFERHASNLQGAV
jgi:hypothetical protein